MNIFIVHNFYQIGGGEDAVMENEVRLLESHGHQIKKYTVNNEQIGSLFSKIVTIINVPFSYSQYKKLLDKLTEEKPDVVHVHNYFPLISPAIFYACKKAKVPVVHTLHNYRAVCPTALLMHNNKINEKCVKGTAWWTVSERVYRGSFVGSLALAIMVEIHKFLKTWLYKVDRFISLTNFSRSKYIESGWPERKVIVKPNFIEDPLENIQEVKQNYALYIGRLSKEKGVDILSEAWDGCLYPLKVVGTGFVNIPATGAVQLCGNKTKQEVFELIKASRFVIVPSICYEGFPMVIVEAFACGVPIICSHLGSMKEIVKDGFTGLHFEPGNPKDLSLKVKWMIEHPKEVQEMGRNCRAEYLEKYTPSINYEKLMNIYRQAIEEVARADEK